MNTIFGWVAAICLAAFVFAFAAGMLLRLWLSRWATNDRFNRVTGKIFAVVVVLGAPLCSLAWLTGCQDLDTFGSRLRAGLSCNSDFGCEPRSLARATAD
jgi:hypothetical protein